MRWRFSRKKAQPVLRGKGVSEGPRPRVVLEAQAFLKLAVPLATAQVAQFAVSFVDTIMMGHLGTASLAAGGLASTTFQMALTVITGFVMSVGVLAAEAYGADKKHRLTGLARQGLWLSLLLAIPFVLLLTQMTTVLTFLQQPETVVTLAQRYYSGIAFGVLPALGFAMLRGYLSAFSLANVVTGVVAIGTAFNIACNYVLGFGKFGFPRLELLGLGIGSSLSLWLMLLLFSVYVFRHPEVSQYQFWREWQYPNSKILRRLATVGAPISLTLILELGMFTTLAFMAGSLGTDVLAAHQISFQVIALIFMVPIGMSQAVTTRVGLWFGRGDIAGARRAGLVATSAVAVFLGGSAIALFTFRPLLIGLFISAQDARSTEVIAIAMTLLLIASIAQVLDGVQRVAMSALYGLQDTRVPVILSAIAFWAVGITTGYVLCFLVGWGVVGLWIGQYTGSAVAGIIFVGRFFSLTHRQSATGR